MQDKRESPSDVTLEWVHGYRCHDCRSNVLYTKPTRDVVFFTGHTVVVRPEHTPDPQSEPGLALSYGVSYRCPHALPALCLCVLPR